MSHKDYIFKKIEELERERQQRKELEKKDRPLTPYEMNCERMPLGCWFWIIGIPLVILYFLGKLF